MCITKLNNKHLISQILSCIQQARSPLDAHNSDALSTVSDLMDILLQEDAFSATYSASSAVSESLTSGSQGNGTSGSQTGGLITTAGLQFFFCYSSFAITLCDNDSRFLLL